MGRLRPALTRLERDHGPQLRARFSASGGTSGLEIGGRGALAVLLRGDCRSAGDCSPPSLYIVDAQGTRVVEAGTGLDETSLAGTGATVYWRDSGHTEYAPLGG